jgi:hypothetical protein
MKALVMDTQLQNTNIYYDFQTRNLIECEEFDKESYEWKKAAFKQFETVYPLCSRYFNSYLHDSSVLSIKYQKGKLLEIRLNDISYIDFCWAFVKHQNIKSSIKKWVFPVVWRFQDLKRCSVFQVNRNNRFLPLSAEKYLPKMRTFLYDELQEISPKRIHIGMEFTTSVCWKNRMRGVMYLEVEAGQLVIQHDQDTAIQSIFDARYLELLKLFQKETQKGVYFDYSIAWDFIEKNKNLIK